MRLRAIDDVMPLNPERWREVAELFDAALALPPEQRDTFIAERAGDDEIAREVTSLIAALDTASDRFDHPALALMETEAGTSLLPSARRIGDRIGAYRIVRSMGHGGMGAIYEAVRDDDQYKKRVAIKTIWRAEDVDVIVRRFRQERQILAGLDHPNIAALLDGGVTEDGQPYFVMEYVDGVRIDEFCAARGLGVRERIALCRQVCAAVQYAHRQLVVHRDLKPNNILVTPDGVVKLLDFGIAKLLPTEEVSDSTMTRAGLQPRTTTYASPEQVRGAPIATASDVYSLGVVFYELVSGRTPFSTPGPTPHVLEWRICEELPERPSAAATEEAAAHMRLSSVQKLRRALEGEVDDIVMMALRKEPERRYASVEQLSEDLRRYLEQLPVIARGDTLRYRAAKFVRRNRALVGTGAVALVAVLLALVAIGVQARVAERERDRARLEAAKAEQLNVYLQGMLRSPDPRVDGQNVTVAQVLDAATQRAESELASQPELQSAAQTALGRTYVGLGLYDKAEAPLRSAVATRRRLGERERLGLAESLDYLAVLLTARGDAQQAEPLITEALNIVRADASVEPLMLARVLHDYGEMLNGKGDYPGAERYHREALDIRRALLGDVHEDVATSLNNLAVQLGQTGRFAEAEPLHRQALEVMRRVKGPEHPDVAAASNTLAFVLAETKNYHAADSLYGQTIALRRKLLGPDHPETAWTVYAQGAMLFDRGDYRRSLDNAREVLRLRAKTLPDAHPLVATALQLEGRSVAALGDPTNALPSLRASLELRRRSLPAAHWLIASSESVLGECLMKAQRYAEAEQHLLRGYQDMVAASGAQHTRSLEARRRLAALYDAWGKPDEAAKYR